MQINGKFRETEIFWYLFHYVFCITIYGLGWLSMVGNLARFVVLRALETTMYIFLIIFELPLLLSRCSAAIVRCQGNEHGYGSARGFERDVDLQGDRISRALRHVATRGRREHQLQRGERWVNLADQRYFSSSCRLSLRKTDCAKCETRALSYSNSVPNFPNTHTSMRCYLYFSRNAPFSTGSYFEDTRGFFFSPRCAGGWKVNSKPHMCIVGAKCRNKLFLRALKPRRRISGSRFNDLDSQNHEECYFNIPNLAISARINSTTVKSCLCLYLCFEVS